MDIQKIGQKIASSQVVKNAAKYANNATTKLGGVIENVLEKSPKKDIY